MEGTSCKAIVIPATGDCLGVTPRNGDMSWKDFLSRAAVISPGRGAEHGTAATREAAATRCNPDQVHPNLEGAGGRPSTPNACGNNLHRERRRGAAWWWAALTPGHGPISRRTRRRRVAAGVGRHLQQIRAGALTRAGIVQEAEARSEIEVWQHDYGGNRGGPRRRRLPL